MDNRIEFILKYLNDNLEKRITLTQVSKMMNLSYGYVSDLFKKETGMNFSHYLKNARMQKARILFKNFFKSIKEISFLTGYRHVSSFCEEFKNMVGVSPSVYRRMENAIDNVDEN